MCQPHLSGGQRRARPTHLGIQRAFELQHVRELLRVDVVVGEVDQQPVHVEPGGGGCPISPPSPQPLSSPHTPLPPGRERLPPSTGRLVRPAHPPSSLAASRSLRHSLAGPPRSYPHPSAAASLRSAGTQGLTTRPRIFRTPTPAREPRTQGPPLTSWRRSRVEATSARLPHEYSGKTGSSGHPRGAAPPSSRRHWLNLPVTPRQERRQKAQCACARQLREVGSGGGGAGGIAEDRRVPRTKR